MIEFDGKLINPAHIAWVGYVQEVKRAKPKPGKGGDRELPPVYNFYIKVGFDGMKSRDYENKEEAESIRSFVISSITNKE